MNVNLMHARVKEASESSIIMYIYIHKYVTHTHTDMSIDSVN